MNRYDPWPELGQAIKALRKERGLTLAQLGAAAGISPQYLSELERDRKNPPMSTLGCIAQGLGISLVELFRKVETI